MKQHHVTLCDHPRRWWDSVCPPQMHGDENKYCLQQHHSCVFRAPFMEQIFLRPGRNVVSRSNDRKSATPQPLVNCSGLWMPQDLNAAQPPIRWPNRLRGTALALVSLMLSSPTTHHGCCLAALHKRGTIEETISDVQWLAAQEHPGWGTAPTRWAKFPNGDSAARTSPSPGTVCLPT